MPNKNDYYEDVWDCPELIPYPKYSSGIAFRRTVVNVVARKSVGIQNLYVSNKKHLPALRTSGVFNVDEEKRYISIKQEHYDAVMKIPFYFGGKERSLLVGTDSDPIMILHCAQRGIVDRNNLFGVKVYKKEGLGSYFTEEILDIAGALYASKDFMLSFELASQTKVELPTSTSGFIHYRRNFAEVEKLVAYHKEVSELILNDSSRVQENVRRQMFETIKDFAPALVKHPEGNIAQFAEFLLKYDGITFDKE